MDVNVSKCYTCAYYQPRISYCEYYLRGKETAVYLCPHCRPKESVLDKIRAEIIEKAKGTMNDTRAEGLYMALNIVDKYKAESEESV